MSTQPRPYEGVIRKDDPPTLEERIRRLSREYREARDVLVGAAEARPRIATLEAQLAEARARIAELEPQIPGLQTAAGLAAVSSVATAGADEDTRAKASAKAAAAAASHQTALSALRAAKSEADALRDELERTREAAGRGGQDVRHRLEETRRELQSALDEAISDRGPAAADRSARERHAAAVAAMPAAYEATQAAARDLEAIRGLLEQAQAELGQRLGAYRSLDFIVQECIGVTSALAPKIQHAAALASEARGALELPIPDEEPPAERPRGGKASR